MRSDAVAGVPAANYAGIQDNLQIRADVAGPASTTVPDVFAGVNAEDAALLEGLEEQVGYTRPS
ncbi:hypothetical protein ACQP0C_32805 [Nocardia sp. CA-129566]|uniref:hypothetical protein n=1 Tax=Nocardia sp. CA-129566 TaxID=3239976 RepID=UPI003D95E524